MSNGISTSVLNLNASIPRKVRVITTLQLQQRAVSRRTGEEIYGGHALLWIAGSETEGPLIVELGHNPAPVPPRQPGNEWYAVRVKDCGVANTGQPIRPHIPPHTTRYELVQGETSLTNTAMFDHQTGTGLVADAWMENPIYRMGFGSPPNTCYDLIVRVLERMGLQLDPVTRFLFADSTDYYTSYSEKMLYRVQDVASMVLSPANPGTLIQTKVFNVDSDYHPSAPTVVWEKNETTRSSNAAFLATVNQLDWETGQNLSVAIS